MPKATDTDLRISVRLPERYKALLEELERSLGLSRSEVIRAALDAMSSRRAK